MWPGTRRRSKGAWAHGRMGEGARGRIGEDINRDTPLVSFRAKRSNHSCHSGLSQARTRNPEGFTIDIREEITMFNLRVQSAIMPSLTVFRDRGVMDYPEMKPLIA